MNKVARNTLLLMVAFFAVILVGKLIGGAAYLFIKYGVITFAVTALSVFIASLLGFGPIGTTSKISLKNTLAITSVICVLASLVLGGLFGAVGAVVGIAVTVGIFRGNL